MHCAGWRRTHRAQADRRGCRACDRYFQAAGSGVAGVQPGSTRAGAPIKASTARTGLSAPAQLSRESLNKCRYLLAFRQLRWQGVRLQEDRLSCKTRQRGERDCLKAPQGAAKTSIRCAVPLAKGYGHSRRGTPCGLNVLDSRRSHLHLIQRFPRLSGKGLAHRTNTSVERRDSICQVADIARINSRQVNTPRRQHVNTGIALQLRHLLRGDAKE